MSWQGTVTFGQNSYYNFSDMNRQSENVQFLLEAIGIIPAKPFIPTQGMTDFPTVTKINNIKSNINAIINDWYAPPGVPVITISPGRLQKFDYIEANKLEVNLEAINKLYNNMVRNFKYSGTFYSGQNIILRT